MATLLIVGTEKGAFVLREEGGPGGWRVDEPRFKGWKVTASARTSSGEWVLATASRVWGPALQRINDLDTWTQVERGPAWSEASGRRLDQIWTVRPGDGAAGEPWWAGVSEAGLFKSEDDGHTWTDVEGLNEHPTRDQWMPGAGGLCAHALLVDPRDADRMWVGISAVGVFRSDDGGASWRALNRGVECVMPDAPPDAEVGYCVHALAADPADANRIWRREHRGMYRTEDGGERWERIDAGLPSTFGFPLVQDPGDGTLYCVPLESDEYRMPPGGRLAVYRSRDGGSSWEPCGTGLSADPFYGLVLRHAMAVAPPLLRGEDGPAGVYFGTSAGTVHGSVDGGERWFELPGVYPRILSLAAYAV